MKSKAIFICVLALLFASCKKDNPVTPDFSIVGKWWVTQTRLTVTPIGEATRTTYVNRNHTDYILFNSDNTGEEVSTPNNGIPTKQLFTYQSADKSIILTYAGSSAISTTINDISTSSLFISKPFFDTTFKTNGILETDYINH